jgi:hypothetical protein
MGIYLGTDAKGADEFLELEGVVADRVPCGE